jgi:hypothetical protein
VEDECAAGFLMTKVAGTVGMGWKEDARGGRADVAGMMT